MTKLSIDQYAAQDDPTFWQMLPARATVAACLVLVSPVILACTVVEQGRRLKDWWERQ